MPKGKTLLLLLLGVLFVTGYTIIGPPRDVYHIIPGSLSGPALCPGTITFAVIGDYGYAGQAEADVAALVDSWQVDVILTTGDNNYPNGTAATIDDNIGQYYQAYIAPYAGAYGPGAAQNRFFPAPGNHDWNTGSLQPYLDYFTLPGNERYYDLVQAPVHIFVLDSDSHEPDGRTATSTQANWLQTEMASSTAAWKLVTLHHPPYSSGVHGNQPALQWPYAAWGVTAVLAGHDHTYERIHRDGILYFVNGLGGHSRYDIGTAVDGSVARYNQDYGAMRILAQDDCINFSFYARTGALIDSYTLYKPDFFAYHFYLPLVKNP